MSFSYAKRNWYLVSTGATDPKEVESLKNEVSELKNMMAELTQVMKNTNKGANKNERNN